MISPRVLFISSNPKGTDSLRVQTEIMAIKDSLKSFNNQSYQIEFTLAAMPKDIQRDILDFKPNIVHFSGHGSNSGIFMEDALGNTQVVTGESLGKLFNLFSEQIDCVIFNSCYSDNHAFEVSKYIDYVIGMSDKISDNAAIHFSIGFYEALLKGNSIERSFEFGKRAISLEGFREDDIPKLLKSDAIKNDSNHDQTNYSSEEYLNKDEWVVGFTYDSPMFFINKKDQMVGFGYELIKRIGENIGKKIQLKAISNSRVSQKILSKEIDLAIGGFIPGLNNGVGLYFSKKYLDANFCLVTHKNDKYEGVEQIDGLRIGVYDEPSAKKWVEKYLPKSADKVFAYSYPNWFDCIKKGEVDVIINDYPYASQSIKMHPELKITNYRISPEDVGYVICLPPSENLKKYIDNELNSVTKEKWFADLHKKYIDFVGVSQDLSYRDDKYKITAYTKTYTTKKDDNFEKIAENQLGDKSKWVLIYNMNKHVLPNPYVMEEGLTLYIPNSQEEIDKKFMQIAIDLAKRGMERNEGGPFGCIIVKDGQIIGTGNNRVTSTNDPTAHAEMVAIRDACDNIKSFQLDGCTVYTSCEPCPMCLGAIYWARPDRIVFACDRFDAANINFDDKFIYDEIEKPYEVRSISTHKVSRDEGLKVFNLWKKKNDKIEY